MVLGLEGGGTPREGGVGPGTRPGAAQKGLKGLVGCPKYPVSALFGQSRRGLGDRGGVGLDEGF